MNIFHFEFRIKKDARICMSSFKSIDTTIKKDFIRGQDFTMYLFGKYLFVESILTEPEFKQKYYQ